MGAIVEGTPHRFVIELNDYQLNYIMNEFINEQISRKYVQTAVAQIQPDELIRKDVIIDPSLGIDSSSSLKDKTIKSVHVTKAPKARDSHGRFKKQSKKSSRLKSRRK